MNVCVYQTSGGKDITQPLLPETKAIVLLLCEEQLDECFFRKRIQFFFCISRLHNRDLPFLKIISIISENKTAGESPLLSFSSVSQCFFRLFLCLQAKKTDALLPRYLVKKEEQTAYI